MNTFMAIMSQLFWGVTIGAISATAAAIAKALCVLAGIGCAGCWALARRRHGRD